MEKYIYFITLSFFSCSPPIPNRCADIIYENNLTYIDGALYTGRCSVYSGDTLKSIQQYSSGKDHGKWTFFYENGSIETKGKFAFGDRVGKWKYYHRNGNLKQISKYKKGIRNGTWREFSEDGKLIKKIKYKQNKSQ